MPYEGYHRWRPVTTHHYRPPLPTIRVFVSPQGPLHFRAAVYIGGGGNGDVSPWRPNGSARVAEIWHAATHADAHAQGVAEAERIAASGVYDWWVAEQAPLLAPGGA